MYCSALEAGITTLIFIRDLPSILVLALRALEWPFMLFGTLS
jgi:hypothetical protein